MLNLTIDQALLALITWGSGLYCVLYIGNRLETRVFKAITIYFWHTLFAIVYGEYVYNYGGDAVAYYERSIGYEPIFKLGTHTVIAFTSIFSNFSSSSFLFVSLIFQTFGAIGLLAFDAAIRDSVLTRPWLRLICQLLIFLPSLSFWTSGIGKDSIAFLAVGLLAWLVAKNKFGLRYTLPVIALLFLVRPHIGTLVVIAFSLSTVITSGKLSKKERFTVGGLSVLAVILLVPFALQYAGVGDTSGPSEVLEYIEERQSENTHGGGGIDIREMSVLLVLLSYMYRPLPFEAHSLAALAASLDNLILILLSIVTVNILFRKRATFFERDRALLFTIIYTFSSWVILALTTANLGIAMRQKWMVVPLLVILIIKLIGRRQKI